MKKLEYDNTPDLARWYDRKYAAMQGTWGTPPEEVNQHLDRARIPFDKTLRLLDVGCGGGHFLEQAEKRVTCLGIDPSFEACHYAKQRVSSLVWCIGIELLRPLVDFDFILCMGSLEHIPDIDGALDAIRRLLGERFYFYVPNELWIHEDQPNERTQTDDEWKALFESHGLKCDLVERIGDCTAFGGT